jgi:hypothetical protein
LTIEQIVVDCARPAALARFWCEVLPDYEIAPYDDEEIERLRSIGIDDIEDDTGVILILKKAAGVRHAGLEVCFQQVPEGKTAKNRVHLDVKLRDRRHLERLVANGASVVGTYDNGDRVVLADPEGNEFCALLPTVR